jgi:hypothetical protein
LWIVAGASGGHSETLSYRPFYQALNMVTSVVEAHLDDRAHVALALFGAAQRAGQPGSGGRRWYV